MSDASYVKVGDRLVFSADGSSGHERFRNGSEVEVVSFVEQAWGRTENATLEPGIWVNTAWLVVRSAEGETHQVGTWDLHFPGEPGRSPSIERQRLRDLPDLSFWEMDTVSLAGEIGGVVSVDYLGVRGSRYSISVSEGLYLKIDESDLVLVERGPVWRRAHGETLTFPSIEHELAFHRLVGEYDHVRNPANGLFSWDADDLVDAVEAGLGHNAHQGQLEAFRDPELGERAREAFLEAQRSFSPG